LIYTLLALSIHCTHISRFFIHSYTAQNDSSFNDGATGDALQNHLKHSLACAFLFSFLIYFTFCAINFTISCFNHVHLQFQTHDIIFYLILAHTYNRLLESDAYPICGDALYVSCIYFESAMSKLVKIV
jgi:hypothetical protein